MASVSSDHNGAKRVQFIDPAGNRKAVRLGKCDKRTAEAVARHVEALLAQRLSGQPLPRETAAWLGSIGDVLRDKLARAGLIEGVHRLTVAEFLPDWLKGKQDHGHKPASLVAWGQTVAELVRLFGPRPLASLTLAEGEHYRDAMKARNLSATTIHKRLVKAKQMLRDAVRLSHLDKNPWEHLRHRAGDPSERRAYVPVAAAERVIEHCSNVWWRLLVALGRFSGLRIPSEGLSLRWRDVDWERGRLTVPCPKLEGHGKPYRVIPLFRLLRPHLEAAFEAAEVGSEFVFPEEYRRRAHGPRGWVNCNLRTTLLKVIRRAGLEPWPKPWHALRASCESDLAQTFPLAVATKWLGNTPSVALRHYVDPTDAAFAQAADWVPDLNRSEAVNAAQKAAQSVQETARKALNTVHYADENTPVFPGFAGPCEPVYKRPVERKGIEPSTSALRTLRSPN